MQGAACSMGLRALAGIAAAAMALPASAGADAVGVVAVAPPPGPGLELLEIADRLRRRIAERSPGALDAEQLRERAAGSAPADALPALERGYERARVAYLEGDFEGSMGALRRVADALERLPDGADVHALWTKVLMRLARTELDMGRPEAARGSLERLLRAVPDLEVDPSLVSARLVEEIEKARTALRASPAGTLVVTSSVSGARVYVNGRDAGPAPVRVERPQGRYRVSGRAEASRVGPYAVDLGGEVREIALDFAVPEALRPWSGQGIAARVEERPRLLVAAGEHLGLDRFVSVALVEEGGLAYVLASDYDVRRQALEREARVRLVDGAIPPGGDSALADFVATGRTDSPLVEVSGARRPPPDLAVAPPAVARALPVAPPEEAPSPGARKALRWSPVATAAAAVAFGTLAVLQLRSAEDSYDRARRYRASVGLASPSDVTTYNGYVADGDAAKGRAGLYWLGAGLSAAGTAVLGWVGYRRTGEFGPLRF